MFANLRRLIPFFDASVSDWAWEARVLSWLTGVWLVMGLIVLFSASYPTASLEHGDGLYYFKRQLIWAIVGSVGFGIVVRTPLKYLLGLARWFLFAVFILLIAILIPGVGTTVNGATRWISIASIPIQPSELLKPFLVLQAAKIFGRWNQLSIRHRFIWLGIWGAILIAILLQPNLSTTALCGMTLWLMALASGLPFKQLGGTALAGMMLAAISITFKEYQRRRILSFLNPWADPDRDGYQLVQSLLAVGSGGAWGTGFGLSQQKLYYLPIQHSDFIFAVFAEEFGFIGSLAFFILLAAYATLALRVALQAQYLAHRLVAMGVMVMMVGQSLVHIGVVTGALPTTGLPLPLFSSGGSSTIASLIAAGLLIRVARESGQAEVISFDRFRSNRRQQLSANGSRSRNGKLP
ncbi:MAG: putative peptidoglycan glycosyltransferase FtsW [Cyanobacteriota bacterium]|nr:putative peptidoglycan glycosyltransferase FtsW [Cyanobacteriota bacterium]